MSRYREPIGPAGQVGEEQRAPRVADLDPRLLVPGGRTVLAQIAAEHDVPAVATRCLSCRWPVGGGQRVCPSRALARCVRERKPVPAWLVHLVDAVPGAIAPRAKTDPAARQVAEDALPGYAEIVAAKRVCAACPVRAACLAFALDALAYGVAGGFSAAERRTIRRDHTRDRREGGRGIGGAA